MRRWAARTDTCQPPIVEGLRRKGVIVFITSALGSGFPDVVCYYPPTNTWLPIELKSDNSISKKSKASQNLKPSQQKSHSLAPIPVASTLAQALALFGITEDNS